jgi:shikimate kinase
MNKRHFLLIGFSCTGKTALAKRAFGAASVMDSDDELLKWVHDKKGERHAHIFQIYMSHGRNQALNVIEEAEKALIGQWAQDETPKIISLGPGFPLHKDEWKKLREVSFVVLLRRSPQEIYESLKQRRTQIFEDCPQAKKHDNWDVGVMVDEQSREYAPWKAVEKIEKLLEQRELDYSDNDGEICTDAGKAFTLSKKLRSAMGDKEKT